MKRKQQLSDAIKALTDSKADLVLPLKIKMVELLFELMELKKDFGIFVILGWREKWQKYADTPDISQDIFALHQFNIMNIKHSHQKTGIARTMNFDGAILIDRAGNVLHSGAMIEGLRPRATAEKLNPGVADDLSSKFGFKRKVHMRHIAAITSSYLFKDTTVFTISEETDDLHIFEKGKIIFSTVSGEPVEKNS